MAILSKPLGKKRALLVAVQHTDYNAGSESENPLKDLKYAHRDAEALRDFLIASHGYQADDITLMKDDINYPKHLWPTRKRILRRMNQLTTDVPEYCHFFFYFSGHGLEERCHHNPSTRADRKDDEIVSADGKPILDHDLHEHLVKPLEKIKGSKLFALFDCCHSETLLDLQIGSGPNHYDREWDYGRGELFKVIANAIIIFLKANNTRPKESRMVSRRASISDEHSSVAKTHKVEGHGVICLSACRDKQFAHDIGGQTFTKCFLEAAKAKQNITWSELRDNVKWEFVSKIQARCEALMQKRFPQDPRICTSLHTDLTEPMTLWL